MPAPAIPSVIHGPAQITYDGVIFYSAGDIVINRNESTFDIESSVGVTGKRQKDLIYEITFTPAGQIGGATGPTAAQYIKLMPSKLISYAATPGSLIRGASVMGKTLVIQSLVSADFAITFANSGVQKAPNMILAPGKPLWGPCTFVAMRKPGQASPYAIAAAAAGAVPTAVVVNEGSFPSFRTLGAYGSLITDIVADDSGFEIDFGYAIQNMPATANYGTIDAVFANVQPVVSFTPVGATTGLTSELDYLKAVGGLTGADAEGATCDTRMPGDMVAGGTKTAPGGVDFTMVGTWADATLTVTIKNAGMVGGGLMYDIAKYRFAKVGVHPMVADLAAATAIVTVVLA